MTAPDSGPDAPDGPDLPSLPDDAAGKAKEVLSSIAEVFDGGLKGVGDALADLLPGAISFAVDVAGGLL